MRTRSVVVLVCVSLLFSWGCKDTSDEVAVQGPTETSNADLILGTWQLRGVTVDPGFDFGTGTPITDLFELMDACTKDNVFIYTANGTFTEDEGVSKCDANDPQTTEGTYSLSADGNTLTQVRNGETEEIKITSINETTMTGASRLIENDIEYTVSLSFEKL